MNVFDPDLSATDMARCTGENTPHAVFHADTGVLSAVGVTRPADALRLIRPLADTTGAPVPTRTDAAEFRLRWYAHTRPHPGGRPGMHMVPPTTRGAFPVMLWHPTEVADTMPLAA